MVRPRRRRPIAEAGSSQGHQSRHVHRFSQPTAFGRAVDCSVRCSRVGSGVQRETFCFDGLRVPVEIRGSAPEALVFLPGLGAHPRYYRQGLEGLAEDFRVVMPDLSFRTHRTLPRDVPAYLALVEALAAEFAPGAPWCGHSFGGLLALLSPGPAIACAPSVPIRVPFLVILGRAIRLQLKEYAGGEGRAGMAYAWRIMLDYVRAGIVTPRALYPVVGDTTGGFDDSFLPAAECAVVFLSRVDCLYRPEEYERYLDRIGTGRVQVERLRAGHDWPVTHPDLVPRLVGEAYGRLRGRLCSGEKGAVDTGGPGSQDSPRPASRDAPRPGLPDEERPTDAGRH